MRPPRCKKRKFRDRIKAEMAILQRQRNDQRRDKTECRAYFCRPCHAWHITSMPQGTPLPAKETTS